MKHDKLFIVLFVAMCMFSCLHETSDDRLPINLDQATDAIAYSEFAQSLDYVELDTRDSCLISDIKAIYSDDDTLCLWDRGGAGIFTFTSAGEWVGQINYFGQGPHEFADISAFTIDPQRNHICIFDIGSRKIMRYTYKGKFVESSRTEAYPQDLVVFPDQTYLCIRPYYAAQSRYGIYRFDRDDRIIKDFNVKIPKDDKFLFVNTYCNKSADSLYYYDRNYDCILRITPDTLYRLYSFDLKQRLSDDLRVKDPSTFKWENFAMMWNFSFSARHVLLNYYYYEQKIPYKWVLLDRQTGTVKIANHITNDFDTIQTDSRSIFFLNEKEWCRVVESEDVNNCNILLQIIHLN